MVSFNTWLCFCWSWWWCRSDTGGWLWKSWSLNYVVCLGRTLRHCLLQRHGKILPETAASQVMSCFNVGW